jgi:hypothetical protein
MRQAHFLQQIQGGQQMEFIENEIQSGHHIGQPRVSFAEITSTQDRNLLASLNLLETQIRNTHRRVVSPTRKNLDFPSNEWAAVGGEKRD